VADRSAWAQPLGARPRSGGATRYPSSSTDSGWSNSEANIYLSGVRYEPSAPLRREQEELLLLLVDAHDATPADQRAPFYLFRVMGGAFLRHLALPDDPPTKPADDDLISLREEGLLRIQQDQGTWLIDVTNRGLAYAGELRRRTEEPIDRIEAEVTRYLRTEGFQQRHPEAFRLWSQAEEESWNRDAPSSVVGHHCREALQEFAHGITENPAAKEKAKTVERIRSRLRQEKLRLGDGTVAWLDALLTYWGTVSDLAQRQEHAGQRASNELTLEDGRVLVFHTGIVMFEIDRALSRPPG
jgi:hypothetical protein